MEQIPEHLIGFMPGLSQDDFRQSPPAVQQYLLNQAQAGYDAQRRSILEALSIFEELVPEEFFDDYVYEEYETIVEEDLFPEFAPMSNQRSNGSFRGHPNNLRALVSRQLALGNQVKFNGTITVRTVTKQCKAVFYNQFTLLRITFNELETDEDDVLFEGTFEISPSE